MSQSNFSTKGHLYKFEILNDTRCDHQSVVRELEFIEVPFSWVTPIYWSKQTVEKILLNGLTTEEMA
jgi:hypothetical protein